MGDEATSESVPDMMLRLNAKRAPLKIAIGGGVIGSLLMAFVIGLARSDLVEPVRFAALIAGLIGGDFMIYNGNQALKVYEATRD